ncbi:MAG: single-stranded-DNA-specific exonuclease RecJ [bacterium]
MKKLENLGDGWLEGECYNGGTMRDIQVGEERVRWVVPDLAEVPEALAKYDFVTAQLLLQRGIVGVEAAEKFLHPELCDLSDPSLFHDLDKAVARIRKAIERREWITVYGDYDVDGITSATILAGALKKLGAQVGVYLPERLKEGYGLNGDAIKRLKGDGTGLLITVDNGTTSVEQIALANSLTMDVIVIDHHQIPAELPTAYALINPKLADCQYPFKDLAAVGVVYHVARKLLGDHEAEEFLDLAALGTIADIVPLVRDNRALAVYGLKVLNETRRPGLMALIEAAGLKGQQLDVYHVGFQLGPRLNAAGRIDHARIAFDLLNATDYVKAQDLARELNALNARRQEMTERIVEEAVGQVAQFKDQKIIVLGGEDWSVGVAGIVASRLVEKFAKPALIFEMQTDVYRGSCRSVEGVHIVELLTRVAEYIDHFGGHAKAAGLSVAANRFSDFRKALYHEAQATISSDSLRHTIGVSLLLEPSFVNSQLLETVGRFAPFGFGNSMPVFACKTVKLMAVEMIGNAGLHLRLTFYDDQNNALQVMAFDGWQLMFELKIGQFYDVAFTVSTREWQGRKFMQAKLTAIRPAR